MFEHEIMTAGELLDKQLPSKPIVVEGMLPTGTYILAGTPKIGKSFFATQLCWSVAEGVPFLGMPTRKSTVLYMTLEDTRERLQARLVRMFGTDWAGDDLHLLFQIEQRGGALIPQLHDFVFDHPETRLIVIDTLQRIREDTGTSFSYKCDYETITPLKTFSDAHDVALIVVHHTRKQTEDENPFNQISGTNGLLGAADGAFLLHREKNEVFLEQSVPDMPGQRYVLSFNRERCIWELVRKELDTIQEPPEPVLEVIAQIVGDGCWAGTATELMRLVKEIEPTLENKPNALTRRLNTLTARLEREYGILYRNHRSSKRRGITFSQKTMDDSNDANDDTLPAGEEPSLPSLASQEGGEMDAV